MKKILLFLSFAVIGTFTAFSLNFLGSNNEDNISSGEYSNMTKAGSAAIAVDLGLPSGTKWADRNVGASSPSQYGNYYAWGETVTKSNYEWYSYKYGNDWKELTKYCTRSDYGKDGFTDNKTVLDLEDDVAHTQWGGSWRMPTKEQFEELIKYTKHKITKKNGVKGRLFTGRNGHSIFLPSAGQYCGTFLFGGTEVTFGYYWSSTLASSSYEAYYLYSTPEGPNIIDTCVPVTERKNGHTIRPVCL